MNQLFLLHLIHPLIDAMNTVYLEVILCVRTQTILFPCEFQYELHESLSLTARTGYVTLSLGCMISVPSYLQVKRITEPLPSA